MTHIKFQNFSLLTQKVQKVQVKQVDASVNHVIVIDVSGSMSYDLPALRTQLKNKLVDLVKDKDTVSIVWFSGRNQFGTLIEDVEIRTLSDLTSVHNAIDRFLRPQGLTGFVQPLNEVGDIIKRIGKKRNTPFSLFFMTDGYDNQWATNEILKAARSLEDSLVNATFVEYGWNCNRALIGQMAEAIGGNHIFSENLQSYQVTFEKELSKRSGGKKIEVKLNTPSAHGFVFTIDKNKSIMVYGVENNAVRIPESTDEIYYFTRTLEGSPYLYTTSPELPQVYAGLSILSSRMMANEIFEVLAVLGDAKLIKKFVNCFSKQDYSDFQTLVLNAVANEGSRFLEGQDLTLVPAEDAYTVLDVLNDLADDEKNLFHPFHEAFEYQRIGAEQVDSNEVVTNSELDALKQKLTETKSVADLKELTLQIVKLEESKVKLTFEYNDKTCGYPINGLIFNEDRPNASLRIKYDGKVKLPPHNVDKGAGRALPESIGTYIYRTYTVIRDGIVHTRKLPVSLTAATFKRLQLNGLLKGESYSEGKVYVLDLSETPVINRKMVKSVTIKELLDKNWEIQKLKGLQKVLNDEYKSKFERTSEGFSLVYGEAAATWLKEIGITDYSGFHPKTTTGAQPDVYMAKVLEVSLKGLSSLPAVSKVRDAITNKKALTVSEWVIAEGLKYLDTFLATKPSDENLKKWLEAERTALKNTIRAKSAELIKLKFSIVVGHVWFSDCSGLDDNSRELDVGYSKKIVATVNLKDQEIGKAKDD